MPRRESGILRRWVYRCLRSMCDADVSDIGADLSFQVCFQREIPLIGTEATKGQMPGSKMISW